MEQIINEKLLDELSNYYNNNKINKPNWVFNSIDVKDSRYIL